MSGRPTPRRMPHWAGLGAASLVALGGYAFLQRGAADDAKIGRLEQQLARMQRELRDVRDRPSPVYVERRVTEPHVLSSSDGRTAAEPEAGADGSRPRADGVPSMAKLASLLDRRLRLEGHSEWSRDTREQIETTVAEHAPRASLVEAECGTSLCRVVLVHPSLADQKAIDELGAHAPFDQGTYYHYTGDESAPRTTLYVVREGHSIRELAEEARR
jgi:hypothetical protein